MTSFRTHRRRVLDPALPPYRRLSALRTCLTCFAPYGLRGTYHHLTLSARIPRDLGDDPQSLARAVEELHEARELWRAHAERWIAGRRTEKRLGRRGTRPGEPWWSAGPFPVAWADPTVHPPLDLPAYVRRRIALADGADLPGCPHCGDERDPGLRATGHGFVEWCRGCRVERRPCPCGRQHHPGDTEAAWPAIWRREHVGGPGDGEQVRRGWGR
ncbi:hypothetical protein GCM10010441_41400 [Kitasatospora paracochleata]|uniref:TniQ protein n=1 Tax=Kitasatospora paracochleata TaxID=58354 RepID=A0ABT1J5M6_9ACTN|nr:hypothetical protein [Kitasatospora paracochleata]MCP2312418.1 hypothetical protein [Kitasatospora paracochleata]